MNKMVLMASAGVLGVSGFPAIAQRELVNPTCNSQTASCLYQKEVYRLQHITHCVDGGREIQTQLSQEARRQFELAAAMGARSILKQFGL